MFSFVLEKHATLKEIHASERYCPWNGKDLKRLMSTRHRLKAAALKSKSRILIDAYRQARERINYQNIQLKRRYFSAKVPEYKGNMKESWKTINEVWNKISKSSNIDCLKDSEYTFVNKKAISNAMNNLFCTIREKLASKIDAVPNPLLSGEAIENSSSVKYQFGSITVEEIRDAIAKIKTTKSFGKDNISCYFLKLAMPFIEKSLADSFNTSVETSQFPELWKLPELHQSSRKVIRLKCRIIALFLFYQSSQGSLKNLSRTNCANT